MNNINCNKIPPFKGWVLENFPFIEADFDAITNYELISKIIEYLNKIIENENKQDEDIIALRNELTNLKNYIDNLDLQEYVDNKLDEMVESGELPEIVASYLNAKALFCFDSLNDLKTSTNLIDGSYAFTYGYYAYKDGGNALYKIREITNEDVVDNRSIVSLTNSNTLIAEFIPENNIVNVDQFGAKGDGTTDDVESIQATLDYCFENGYNINFSKKTYLISEALIINKSGVIKITINGNYATIKGNINDYLIKSTINTSQQFIIENIELNGNYGSSGLLIKRSQRFSIKNVVFHYCIKGLTIINSWYGNLDNNCLFDACLHGINLEEDLEDAYYGEVNTIEVGNLSIDSHNVVSTSFGIADEKSTGITVNTMVHAVKFIGTVVENCDIGIKGCETLRAAYSGLAANISFDKCYFEDCSYRLIDWTGTNDHYINTLFIFTNNNVHPLATLDAYVNHSRFFMQNNMFFNLIPYVDNRQLQIITDLNDYYIKTENCNYTTKIEKIENYITRSSVMKTSNMAQAQDYPDTTNYNLATQEDNYLMYQFKYGSDNVTMKNSKALCINSKNISFEPQGLNPVGLIINGTDDNKYMLSTDGTDLVLIKMTNLNRIYERANSHDAYWLYSHKNTLPDGYKSYCNDIGKKVILHKEDDVGEWWTDETNSYLCIGTSESLIANQSSQPSFYWKPCWDLSFNHGVFWHGNKYNVAYDWAMNNNPQDTNTQILAYGVIASRPATPTYPAIYYATDENKYYKYEDDTWTEVTKIM